MIEIKNLSKSYGEKSIYKDFDLTLGEGVITCLMGASGSGKTTLLNVLANLTPFKGEVPPLRCSYIFQSPTLVPNLTVYKNLALVCADGARINEMLSVTGLSGKAQSYPVHLSGGEAQRVAIARAFLFESDIMLMDEPFSSLDVKLKRSMYELFTDIWKRDKRTVLFVTHDPDEAVTLSNRILVLENGKITFDMEASGDLPRSFEDSLDLRRKLGEFLLK